MSTSPSSTVLKAFSVLDLFRLYPQLGVTQCGDLLRIPRPTAHRLLTSLAIAGALERTGSGAYRLSLRMFEIGAQAPVFRAFQEQAQVAMEQLVTETRLAGHLGVRDGGEVVYLLKVRHEAGRVRTRVGQRNPLYATGLGKVLLAHADEDEVRRSVGMGFRRYTPYTVTSMGALHTQLDSVRRTGYGYDLEERQLGVTCIARAVCDRTGRVLAAVSLSAPAEKYRDRLDSLRPPLQRAVSSIESALDLLPVSPHNYLREAAAPLGARMAAESDRLDDGGGLEEAAANLMTS